MRFSIPGTNYVADTSSGTVVEEKVEATFSDVGSASGDWDGWLKSLLNVLTIMRGASDRPMPLTGIMIPMVTGVDTMTVAAMLTPHVVLACKRLTGLNGPVPSDRVGDDGKVSNDAVSILAAEASIKIGWVAYLAAEPDPANGAIRGATIRGQSTGLGGMIPGGLTLIGGKVADPNDLKAAISIVQYWQSCVDQSVHAIEACGANGVGAVTPLDNAAAFFTAVQHLTTQLDLVKQDAASTTADVLKAGLEAGKNAAVGLAEDVAKGAGDITARLANEAGVIAGNVAQGFFGQIGTIGYFVTAIIIYLAFYR